MTNDAKPLTNDAKPLILLKHKWEPSLLIVPISLPSSKCRAVPGYGYSDRLSLPDFCLPASVQKMLPSPFLRMCYHPVSGVSVAPLPGITSGAGFGGRSALLIVVRVALLLPSDDEPVSAFAFPGSGKQAAVAEASDSPLRRQAQPSKEHLAVAGACRFPSVLPSVSGSCPSGSQASTCLVRTSSQLRSALFPLLSGLPFIAHLMYQK
jgi:hypothetical protein